MARTAVQSDASTNKVANLSYQVRGSFRIVEFTGGRSYVVQKLFKADSPALKFMVAGLYLLPSSLNRVNMLIVQILGI